MNDRHIINTEKAPLPVGPYSQAVKCGGMVFLAGQIAIDPKTGKLIDGDTAAQTELILRHVETLLEYSGLTMGNVVRCVVYLADIRDTPAMNQVYGKHFFFEPPARTTIQAAALPLGARVEIEVTAVIPPAPKSTGTGLML